MDYAQEFAAQAQRWHDTDHGKDRGRPLRRSKFIEPVVEELPPVPESFRECPLCRPTAETPFELRERNNPYWFRVVAWESN